MTVDARFHFTRGDFRLAAELSVPARGVSAIFGPSGSGKTLLLRAVAGLEACEEGYLEVGGEIWQDGKRFLPPHRRSVGYVFQEPSLFRHLSVRGNLEYGYKRLSSDERRVSFDKAVELLGVKPLMERQPDGLSGGERQRVAIARALLASPRLLLMDEPLAALDMASKSEIIPFLVRLHEELKIPVLYVSHSLEEVARFADYLILLEAGEVRCVGPIAEMLTRLDLPLAAGDDAEAMIEARVEGHDSNYDLTHLAFAGGSFTVPRRDLPIGKGVRVRILARDVSVTLEQQTGTSISNILRAKVTGLSEKSPARMVVRLDSAGCPFLSHITRKSAAELDLAPGKQVYAQIKSLSLIG